ncbi:hypothetical protein CYMTET_29033, partial [Cymbomonas tetramitiformis]
MLILCCNIVFNLLKNSETHGAKFTSSKVALCLACLSTLSLLSISAVESFDDERSSATVGESEDVDDYAAASSSSDGSGLVQACVREMTIISGIGSNTSGKYALKVGDLRRDAVALVEGSAVSVTLYDITGVPSFTGFVVISTSGFFSSFDNEGKAKICDEKSYLQRSQHGSAWTNSSSSLKASVTATLTVGEAGKTTLLYYVVKDSSNWNGPLSTTFEVQTDIFSSFKQVDTLDSIVISSSTIKDTYQYNLEEYARRHLQQTTP